MRKVLASLVLFAVILGTVSLAFTLGTQRAHAANPWGASSTEWWNDLGYDGHVWFFDNRVGVSGGASVVATSGWMRYYAGQPGRSDTGRIYAVKQIGGPQPGLWQAKTSYWDTISWDPGYKTVFTYGFSFRAA